MKNFNEWLDTFNDEEQEEILEKAFDENEEIAAVEMGYRTLEEVADGYFNNVYSIYAHVNEFKNSYILFLDNQPCKESKVYNNKEEALEELKKLENSLYKSIDKQIEEFKAGLQEDKNRVEIEVKKEYNNSGNYYSFNIYLDENLLVDGVFNLDPEEVKKDIESIDNFKEEIYNEYNIFVTDVKKTKSNFERYYDFEFTKGENIFTTTVHIPGSLQGKTRNTIDFIKDIDIEEILENLDIE